jgi:hypothetical protein
MPKETSKTSIKAATASSKSTKAAASAKTAVPSSREPKLAVKKGMEELDLAAPSSDEEPDEESDEEQKQFDPEEADSDFEDDKATKFQQFSRSEVNRIKSNAVLKGLVPEDAAFNYRYTITVVLYDKASADY